MIFAQAHKYTWKINNTLRGGEIHGPQNEPSFSFIHLCIDKDFISYDLLAN